MNQLNHQNYYRERAKASRDLAEQAANPAIAAIHSEFAARYDKMAAQSEKRSDGAGGSAQAA